MPGQGNSIILRCLACWGRMRWLPQTDWYVCDDCDHVVSGVAYFTWRCACKRPPGIVIGPATSEDGTDYRRFLRGTHVHR